MKFTDEKEGDVVVNRIEDHYGTFNMWSVIDNTWNGTVELTENFVENIKSISDYHSNPESGSYFDFLPDDRLIGCKLMLKEIYKKELITAISNIPVNISPISLYDMLIMIIHTLLELGNFIEDILIELVKGRENILAILATTFLSLGYWDVGFALVNYIFMFGSPNKKYKMFSDLCELGFYGLAREFIVLLVDLVDNKQFVPEKILRIISREKYFNTFRLLLDYNQRFTIMDLNYAIYYSSNEIATMIHQTGVEISRNNNDDKIDSKFFQKMSTMTCAMLSLNTETVDLALDLGCSFSEFSLYAYINFYYRLMPDRTKDEYYAFFEQFFDKLIVKDQLLKAIRSEIDYFYKKRNTFVKYMEFKYPHSANSSIALFELFEKHMTEEEIYKFIRRMKLGAVISKDANIWKFFFNKYGYPDYSLYSSVIKTNSPVMFYLRENDPNFTEIDPVEFFSKYKLFTIACPDLMFIFGKKLPSSATLQKYKEYLNKHFDIKAESAYYYEHPFSLYSYNFNDIIEFYYRLGLNRLPEEDIMLEDDIFT